MAAHPGDQVMTLLNFALIHHKSLPDPFWSHEFLSGLPSLISRHVSFVKSGSISPRLIYLSPYLNEKSELFTQRFSWQSPEIRGAQGECRFEENSCCTAGCCVWQCWYSQELCVWTGFSPHFQCINQPVLSLSGLSQFSCLLFSHRRITDGKLWQTH